jgi:hypothetical protein
MRRIFITALLLLLMVSLAHGATVYLYGEPDFEASVLGPAEFRPGTDTEITISLRNSGLNEFKVETALPSAGNGLPNTARMVTAALDAGNAPVIVKTDPQMVGDIEGGESLTVPFFIRIASDAPAGTHPLLLQLSYTYLHDTEQADPGTAIYHYQTGNTTLEVPIRIRAEVYPEIVDSTPEHLNAGGEGYINLKVGNSGYLEGKSSVLLILRNDESPVVPVDSSVYIGDFAPGVIVEARYKVNILETAEENTYPLDLAVEYIDDRGDTVRSDLITVGVPVSGEIRFDILSPLVTMYVGSAETIQVEYENTGTTGVYSAQARLIVSDPFTSTEDTAYLGDLDPGERAVAQFTISADKTATVKEYGLDTEIRYRDALDNSRISDRMVVKVQIATRTGIEQILYSPVIMSIIGALVILIIYYAAFYRKRNKREKDRVN